MGLTSPPTALRLAIFNWTMRNAANIAATLEYNADAAERSSYRFTPRNSLTSSTNRQPVLRKMVCPKLHIYRKTQTFTASTLSSPLRSVSGTRVSVEVSLKFDWVSASLDVSGNDHIPRTPPLRYGIGVLGELGSSHRVTRFPERR